MQKINEGIVFICAFCGWLYWFRRIMIVWLSCRKLKWRINQNTNYSWKTKVGSILDFSFDIDTGQNSFKYDFDIFDIDFIPVVDITAKHLAVGWGIMVAKNISMLFVRHRVWLLPLQWHSAKKCVISLHSVPLFCPICNIKVYSIPQVPSASRHCT